MGDNLLKPTLDFSVGLLFLPLPQAFPGLSGEHGN